MDPAGESGPRRRPVRRAPYHHDVPRTDRAARSVAASVTDVYAAFVDPEALSAWLPPGDMLGTIERFDLRPGGSYRMVLRYPDHLGAVGKTTADTDVVEARFLDVVPDARVVIAVDSSPRTLRSRAR